MPEVNHRVAIREAYKCLNATELPRCIVERLLGGIPNKYLNGLKTVVLTDSEALNHNRKRHKTSFRGEKILICKAYALYHGARQCEPAWIEIFVDNVIAGWPKWVLKVPLFGDIAYAHVLLHELGHHIHKTQVPQFGEREDIADFWGKQLSQLYFKRKYWYLVPLILPLALALKLGKVKGDSH